MRVWTDQLYLDDDWTACMISIMGDGDERGSVR